MGSSCKCSLNRKEELENKDNYESNLKAVEDVMSKLNSQGLSHTGIWPNLNVGKLLPS